MERFIELLKYLLLALVQGVGEVLPISSSGHLLIFRKLLGIDVEGITIEVILHLASLFALFIYYRKTIFTLIKGNCLYLFKKEKIYEKDFIFVKGMIISLIPTCIAGYFFDDYLNYFIKYSFLIGIFLVLNGVNLYLIRNKKTYKNISELSLLSFIKIGLGQCLGLVPGFSRSGSALAMCYRENLNKDDSEKFTFLMLFPLVIGSFILNFNEFSFDDDFRLLIISFIVSFLITLISIRLLNKIINNNRLHYFCYYCLIVGIFIMFI